MQELLSYLPDFADALMVTLGISIASSVIGLLLGFGLNALRLVLPGFIAVYRVYVWLIRGTPFLAQLMVIYFGLPVIGLRLEAVEASILSLALYSAAYFAELFRSAWASVPNGQLEAARVHGISRSKMFWHVQTPQALAFALPLLGNQVILTIKESAVTSIITVPELTMTAGRIVSTTFSYVMPYALLVLSYWLLTCSVAALAGLLGRRMTRHLRG
ncbi:amino acid ABC transporter permease [Pseudomonas sp.]|uniref:amino acid ABC transporter permease n=1 Tax=Pseudomonas sp. TaxID=306 RepID=UPI00260C8DC9|nr:amino acid ABC transporter permease [Pseudomonas sp.]